MKIVTLFFIFFSFAATCQAQYYLPPEGEKVVLTGFDPIHGWLEFNLVRTGDKFNGSYFYFKFRKAKSVRVSGPIGRDGRFVLERFNIANKRIGYFEGALQKIDQNGDIYVTGSWKKFEPGDDPSPDLLACGQIVSFTGNRRIETHLTKERNGAKHFALLSAYPEIVGEDTARFGEINRRFKNTIDAPTIQFRRKMLQRTPRELKLAGRGMSGFGAEYIVKFADDDFISVEFTRTLTEANTRTSRTVITLTYDLKNVREVKLADLFKPDSKYLEAISAYCVKTLERRPFKPDINLTEKDWQNATAPNAKNYTRWNLTRNGLLVSFAGTKLSRGAYDVRSIIVPYSLLRQFALPGGAIEKITRGEI